VNSSDYAYAIALDDSGNIYVTGFSGGAGDDYATIKYAPDGTQIWVRRYNNGGDDLAYAIAVDDSGVYVTGESDGSGTGKDCATIKYDLNGTELWVTRYNGPANGDDYGWDIAVDGSGNAYVAGVSWNGTDYDYFIIKYAPDGTPIWEQRYIGPGDNIYFTPALAVDASGNIYVTGGSPGIGGNDYVTIKYASDGNKIWEQRYNGPANGDDFASDIAVNDCGNVYVTGCSDGVGTGKDYVTIKYSQLTLTINIDPADSGSVIKDIDKDIYDCEVQVTLTAQPNEGYKFDHWSGALSGSENPTTITMDSDKTVTAHFVRVYTLTVNIDSVDGGSVSLSPDGGTYDAGTVVRLTAAPKANYKFDRWSGALSESENPTTITMDSDKTATAHFVCACTKFPVGDVSGNGTVTAYDAALILQFVVGLIGEFPCESVMGNSPENLVPRDYEVSIPQISLKAGQRVFVPVQINDATGLVAGGIVLKYDSTVLRAVKVAPLLRQAYWEANTDLNGEVRFAFVSANPSNKSDKQLLLIEFEALPNTEGKTSPLILEHVQLSDSLSVKKINGLVTVLPSEFRLRQNYPNPFNPDTWLPYQLAQDATVTISIYNTKGQHIRTLYPGNQKAGIYTAKDRAAYWNGCDQTGESVASGVYFYTLQAGEFTATRRMLIVK